MNHHHRAAFAALVLSSFFAAAHASESQPETVVVTATRTPQPREVTGVSISIISAADLKARQIVSVGDALAQTPGLTIVRNGGTGQPTAIGMRGAPAGQTLLLIDGVRINDPSVTDGPPVLADVLANGVARIEILRGPQSTLYGSDAIGGVVNILTQRGGVNPFALRASVESGSFDTYRINAAASGTWDDLEYGVAANLFHSNGTPSAEKHSGNPETDGYGNLGLTANTRYRASDNVSLDLRAYYTRARSDFDDNFAFTPPYLVADSAAYNTNVLTAGYAGINADAFGGIFRNRLSVSASHSHRQFYDSAFDVLHRNGDNNGDSLRFEYQGIVDVSASDQLTFGAETQRASFQSDNFNSFFGNTHEHGHATISGFYAQYQTALFDTLTLIGGIRRDEHDVFGGHTSLKLAGAWKLMDGSTVLRANYGDGFKAPTLYQLYSQYSNPIAALAPEVARGWEAGIDQYFLGGRFRASLTWYERRTQDQIDFYSCYGVIAPQYAAACAARAAEGGFYYNVGRTRARGLEFEAEARLFDQLSLTGNLTAASARDLLANAPLARRPHVIGNVGVNYHPEGWSIGARLGFVGKRFDGAFRSGVLGSNTVADVFGTYDLDDDLELFARVENAFDARYEPVLGYGAPGRSFMIGVRLSR